MIGLSKSKAARLAQYNDLRRRGYTAEEAEADVIRTDEAIDHARARAKQDARDNA